MQAKNKLKCPKCGHIWNYKGKAKIAATCPSCIQKISIKKNKAVISWNQPPELLIIFKNYILSRSDLPYQDHQKMIWNNRPDIYAMRIPVPPKYRKESHSPRQFSSHQPWFYILPEAKASLWECIPDPDYRKCHHEVVC